VRRALTRRTAAALAAVALLAVAWLTVGRRLGVPSRRVYPVRGIDVSHHQSDVRWDAVAAGGTAFAYIKATEGGDYRDPRFAENWDGAARAGVVPGAYHYFTFCRDGQSQAENFLAALSTAAAASPSLPPALDLEFRGNCARRPTPQELHDELADFVGRVERRTGQVPIYYATPDFLRAYGDALPEDAAIWVRSTFWRPGDLGRPWVIWQYSGRASSPGVKGPVDADVFNGSKDEWRAFLTRSTTLEGGPPSADGG
jgi:lysozyme